MKRGMGASAAQEDDAASPDVPRSSSGSMANPESDRTWDRSGSEKDLFGEDDEDIGAMPLGQARRPNSLLPPLPVGDSSNESSVEDQ